MQACVSEKALEDYFRQYGKIVSVKVLYDRHCAFVNFAAATSAQRAVKAANVSRSTPSSCLGLNRHVLLHHNKLAWHNFNLVLC